MIFANEKTLSDLDWPRLKEAIAERCVGEAGRRLALALPFAATRDEARTALEEVREAKVGGDLGELLPVAGARDVEATIARLEVSGVLAPTELRDVLAVLGAARRLRRHLAVHASRTPHLARACTTDAALDAVEDELMQAFDPDGTLSDLASPRLRELRAEQRATRARMVSRLEELVRKYAHVLSDTFWTEREGRYVLPVRTDAHERFPGLVHATSGSGATLFVEPRATIPLGNRLKMLEGDVFREEEAIYAKLSALLAEHLASVAFAAEALARADVRRASAILARDLKLVFVDVDDEPIAELQRARHPLLALDGVDVVPSDLRVASGRAVVVSGPNAGGKTVAMKTIGLAALMLRAGLPLPCLEGSRMGFFENVLTDVGDEQSLTKNLSTFSAHVKNVSHILDEAQRGTLVLVDELATGTDPREGEALAAAVLDSLCARGSAVICTTHYEGLKTLALADPRFENASVGFDVATMEPTFQVVFGVPGASSALAVARRFGIPETVLERADRFLSKEDREIEQVVARLHDERRALGLARAAAESAEQAASARATELEREIERVRSRQAEELDREIEALALATRRARDDLREAQAILRAKRNDERALREAQAALDSVSQRLAIGGELDRSRAREGDRERLAEGELRKGARVYVPRLRSEVDVVEVLPDGRARVAAGALRLTVDVGEVRRVTREPAPIPGKKGSAPSALEVPVQTSDNTCDLRGLRIEDGVAMATQYLDRSVNAGRGVVFLLHGRGTGAMREAIREAVKTSAYVRASRAGERSEGGDAVTVVWLK